MAISLVWGVSPHLACQKSSLMAEDDACLLDLPPPARLLLILLRRLTRADTATSVCWRLGDSYTIGQSVSEADRYPQQLVKKLCTNDQICFEKPEIIATTGWTTGNLLDALAAADTSGSGPSGSLPPAQVLPVPIRPSPCLLVSTTNSRDAARKNIPHSFQPYCSDPSPWQETSPLMCWSCQFRIIR